MNSQTKSVDPSVYTREYYLSDCTGFKEFKDSFGEELEIRFKELVKYFEIKKGMRVLDVGCGRGEMVLFASKHNAIGYGIDYSKSAIELANMLKRKQPEKIRDNMHFKVMDAKKMKFTSSSFDLIILADVVEHLYDEELDLVFSEIYRLLKKSGILILHTAPNKLFNEITYKYYSYPVSTLLVSFWNFITKNKYPNIAKPEFLRTSSHKIMHINEQTYFSLRSLSKKYKFKGSIVSSNITVKKQTLSIKDIFFNFLVFLHPLSKLFPLNVFFGSDFISVLRVNK